MSLASEENPPVTEQANRSNWRNTPFSRWAFRNIRDILPVADIGDSAGNPMELPARPLTFEQFRLASGSGSSMSLEHVLRATATDGFVILFDGRVVYEFYDHDTSAHTPHIVMSASKSVVGLIAGILQGNGDLDADAPVSHYIPEVAATAYRGATVRHLLDMRAGNVLDERQSRAYAAATNWEPPVEGETPIGLHTFFENLTAAAQKPHGGSFSYVSANTDLLGWVIERATGNRFASLAAELLWKPMGAEHAAYITVDRDGAPRCTGGLCATTRDFARIGQLMVMNGSRGGIEVVPSGWIDDIADQGDPEAWKQGEFAAFFGGRNMSYRSGWYVINDEPKTLFAMGIHGQNLFVDRHNRIVIAKLSSQNAPIDYQATALTHRAVGEIRRCLLEA
jgi:CubicO group peptidase (beta-lactamase class C family)